MRVLTARLTSSEAFPLNLSTPAHGAYDLLHPCVRVNVHSGARVTDQGIIGGEAANTLRLRRTLEADGRIQGHKEVQIWADVDVKHSAALAPRAIEFEAADLAHRGMVDAVLVTGEGTGHAVDTSKLETVRKVVRDLPLLVASGATKDSLVELAKHCDGVIVGSALRSDGRAGGPIDKGRANEFANAFRKAFG